MAVIGAFLTKYAAAIGATSAVATAGTTTSAAHQQRKAARTTSSIAASKAAEEKKRIAGAEGKAAETAEGERRKRLKRTRTVLTAPRGALLAPGQVAGKTLLGA